MKSTRYKEKYKLCICCKKTNILNIDRYKYCKNCSRHVFSKKRDEMGRVTQKYKTIIRNIIKGGCWLSQTHNVVCPMEKKYAKYKIKRKKQNNPI